MRGDVYKAHCSRDCGVLEANGLRLAGPSLGSEALWIREGEHVQRIDRHLRYYTVA